ncbi:MAG TPA: SsrA-binding protein SmpB [Acidimicrobiales bacterium]|nr:SsrA-binding protein SmpB [Acidimicrobiales bacterium]
MSSKNKGAKKASAMASGVRPVAQNRRARFDFDILDTVEAGIVLVGSEVKSVRDGNIALRDSYARVQDGEVWLHGVHIAPYVFATGFGAVDSDRSRKLLLHRRQIDELAERVGQEQLTLVPLAVYFKDGHAKVDLALARGRRRYDKRHAIAERDAAAEARRAAAASRRGLDPE